MLKKKNKKKNIYIYIKALFMNTIFMFFNRNHNNLKLGSGIMPDQE